MIIKAFMPSPPSTNFRSIPVTISEVEYVSKIPDSIGNWKKATFIRLSNGTCLWIKGTHKIHEREVADGKK